jgi:hemolysin activation/secretion protein
MGALEIPILVARHLRPKRSEKGGVLHLPGEYNKKRTLYGGLRNVRLCVAAVFYRGALRIGVASIFFALVGLPTQLSAQNFPTSSQVTPPTLRPAPTPGGGVIIPEAPGLQAPSGADKISVTLRRVIVQGAFEDMADANMQLAKAIERKRLTVEQVYQAAQAFESAYAAAGYILVRVTLPPQELKDGGTVRLILVDGFVEAIDVKGVPERVRAVVAARTNALIGKRHIKLVEIERRLLIAGDAPGLRLRSTLARGEREGGAKLILEGAYRPITGSVGADNRLPVPLGTWSYNSSLALNSVFGLGEQFYGSLVAPNPIGDTFDAAARIRVVGGGAVIPLGVDGWILNPEYTLSRTRPSAPAGLDAVAWFERWAVRTSYPLIRERARTLVLQGAFEAITQHTEPAVGGLDLKRDRYQVLRGGADVGFPTPWGAGVQASILFSRGLGGRDQADAPPADPAVIPLTRQGAEPIFSKLSGAIRIQQPLPESFQLALIGRGQSSFNKPLLQSEMFALDAVDGVSSFTTGSFMVDEGVSGRAELMRPFEWRTQEFATTLMPYVFGARGRGYLRMPTNEEPLSMWAGSIGVGLRTGLDQLSGFNGLSATVEWGKQYTDNPRIPVGYRTTASVSLKF